MLSVNCHFTIQSICNYSDFVRYNYQLLLGKTALKSDLESSYRWKKILNRITLCFLYVFLLSSSKKKMFQNFSSGVNFTNILQAAFMHAEPKSTIKTVKWSSFFALLGFACVKAALRMFVKLTLDRLCFFCLRSFFLFRFLFIQWIM